MKALVDGLGGMLAIVRTADPDDRAEVYKELGLRLTYDRESNTVLAETRPTSSMCVESVSEARLDHHAHALHLQQRLLLVSLMGLEARRRSGSVRFVAVVARRPGYPRDMSALADDGPSC